ncbi:uncharacterized protein LOC120418988 [Culex pipiens pallens]|uniref:uncharacterized protein LOC120418988 n=1 Tax=Culex pipiens pallens TaxID=42434 RepID=UPI0019544DD9|nr:uncharacterized protein LOC120418988 [Culex pipiens pallens]
MTMKTMRLASIHLSSGTTAVTCSDSLSRSRTSLRSETASSAAGGGHSHHHHHHHHRRQASSTSSTSCLLVARQTRTDDDETPEEEAAGTTATCNTEDERHPESASTLYVENCHCSRGNLTTTTTTDDDEELQQYFINRSVSRRPSNVSSTSRVSHRSNRSTPRSGGGGGGGGGSGGSSRSRQQSKRATPLSGVSCCSHHSHHSTQPQTYRSRGGPDSPSFLQDSGSNATISNFNINPARFQCSYYTADESENSYCSISGENIRQIQAQTQIQTALEMRQKEHEWILKRPEQPAPPPPSRLQPLPLPPLPPPDGGSDYNDSQQDVNSINGSITSIIESTSSDQPGGSTTTSTTTSTTQRQLQHVGERGGTKNGSSSGSQMILTPSKITIENIGQLSEIAANDYDFDDIDVSIPEMFHSPSKIKWNFLAGLEENKSNKSRISSISSLVDAASSGRGRSGTESGGADVSETGSERRRDDSSDNDYSPNRIQHQPLPPLPTPPPQSSSSCKIEELLKKSSPSASSEFKTVSIWRAENDDEANAIIFHHESEIVENCCNNHFLDHSSYDICTVDNCDYLIKSSDTKSEGKGSIYSAKSEERLNNSVALSSSAAANKLELKQRNIFTSTLLSASATPANVYSIISPDLKRFEKQTNLNRNSVNLSQNLSSPSSSSSSSIFLGNYNQTYRNINQNNGEDKLLNTSSSRSRPAPTAPAPPPPVATTSRSTTSVGFNNAADAPPPDASPLEPAPPFSITAAASTATAAAASQFYNKSYHINLTAQNRLYFHAYSNAVREMEQCPHQSPSPTSIQSERSPQPCAQCQELYGSPFFYSSTNATNEDSTGTGGTFADIANTSSSASLTGSGTGAGHRRGGGARPGSVRWRRNVSHSLRINGLVRVVRTRARKCADYIRHKERLTQNRFHRRNPEHGPYRTGCVNAVPDQGQDLKLPETAGTFQIKRCCSTSPSATSSANRLRAFVQPRTYAVGSRIPEVSAPGASTK